MQPVESVSPRQTTRPSVCPTVSVSTLQVLAGRRGRACLGGPPRGSHRPANARPRSRCGPLVCTSTPTGCKHAPHPLSLPCPHPVAITLHARQGTSYIGTAAQLHFGSSPAKKSSLAHLRAVSLSAAPTHTPAAGGRGIPSFPVQERRGAAYAG